MIQLGIFAKTFSGDRLDTIFRKVKAQGISVAHFNFSCVGLPSLPTEIDDATIQQIQQTAQRHKLEIPSISATFNMISPNTQEVGKGITAFAAIARVAPLLGAKTITLCTGSRNQQDKWAWHPGNATTEAWQEMLTVFEKILAVAEKHDLWLGVEPEAANVVSDAQKARQLIEELQSDRIKIVLDPANLFEKGTFDKLRPVLAEAIDLLHPQLIMAHAKDRKADGTFCAAGQGVVDFGYFIEKLTQAGFDGPLVLHGLAEAEVPAAAHFLQQKLLN